MTPERYKDAKWEDVPPKIQTAVAEMLAGGKGIYLYGGVGVGKTHIAYGIKAHIEAQPGGWLRFWNVTDLLREVRADFSRQEEQKRRPDEGLTQISSLGTKHPAILDDIGAEKSTDFVIETLYHIINERYNKCLPTIFTSNLSLDQLAGVVGERSASRIAEMCKVIHMTGVDKRINR